MALKFSWQIIRETILLTAICSCKYDCHVELKRAQSMKIFISIVLLFDLKIS